ncbi:helix-turn-helix domain-containing protein [Sinomicrobium sp. M5D2P9]
MNRFITTFLISAIYNCVLFGQTDTLLSRPYEKLVESYGKGASFEKKEIFAKAIIRKAKKEKDTSWIISGYHIMTDLYNDVNVLKYCDSIISLSTNPDDKYYPATANLIKGVYYYNKRDFQKALDEYLVAKKLATRNYNPYLIQKINYSIGILKDRIGESEEALKIHQENFSYTRKNIQLVDKQDYLFSIFALASTFNDLRILDSASYYNNFGVKEAIKLDNETEYNHFILNEGVTLFYQNRYAEALDSIEKSTAYFEEIENLPNMAVGYFYSGKVYSELGKTDSTILYFKKVDTVFQKNNDLLPVVRESYEYLINHYKQQNDLKQQLIYIKQLIKLDSILYNDKIYLSSNIVREYDIPRLMSAKENVITSLQRKEARSRFVILFVSIGLVLMTILFCYQYYKKKMYKRRFEDIFNSEQIDLTSATKKLESQKDRDKIDLPEEVVKNILFDLDGFEKDKKFLNSNITIQILAKRIGTNSNYLSKVVNFYKKQSFINYINQLRITYAIEELKTNTEYRKYTIKAIAKEFGFNNSESFSSAFYKNTGIKLSYFIKELSKKDIKHEALVEK